MKILFVVPSYKPAYIYGGPIVVIALLAETLVKLGHSVTVFTTTANGKEELPYTSGKTIIVDGVDVVYFKRTTADPTNISFQLWQYLYKYIKDFDVVHLHSWWNFLTIGAAFVCKIKGVQPVLSPHGMFSNYILTQNNQFKKACIQWLIGKKLLRNTKLHVSTQMEWQESQQVISNWQGNIIPNLVTLSSNSYKKPDNKIFTIGFLSRIDPKKGLNILMMALAKVSFPFKLLVAGSGDANYLSALKELAINQKISDKIEWVGWKNGEEKFEFLSSLDLFALTSHSENFAIVVIESLSVGTPVLLSNQVGLANFVLENDFGWITDNKVDNIVDNLNDIYYEKAEDRKAITLNAVQNIKAKFDDFELAKQYLKLYYTINNYV